MLKPALRIPLLLALVSALLTPGVVGAQGILLLAHGGRDDWNRQVLELASQVDSTLPVEVAFGMANKRMIQDAVDRLRRRLEGLPYRMARQALLPDERLSQWVLMQAGAR